MRRDRVSLMERVGLSRVEQNRTPFLTFRTYANFFPISQFFVEARGLSPLFLRLTA